jgi:hypothetical protein
MLLEPLPAFLRPTRLLPGARHASTCRGGWTQRPQRCHTTPLSTKLLTCFMRCASAMYAIASYLHTIFVTLSPGTSCCVLNILRLFPGKIAVALQRCISSSLRFSSHAWAFSWASSPKGTFFRYRFFAQRSRSTACPNAAAPPPALAIAHQPSANQRQQLPAQALFQVMQSAASAFEIVLSQVCGRCSRWTVAAKFYDLPCTH